MAVCSAFALNRNCFFIAAALRPRRQIAGCHILDAIYREAVELAVPQNLEEFVAELVQTAGYQGPDEVVSEALREHRARRQGPEVVMTPELERLLDEGLQNLEQSKTTDELRRQS